MSIAILCGPLRAEGAIVLRRLTAVLIAFLILTNAIIPPRAHAIAPLAAGLGKFLLGWAAGKVLDYAFDAVLDAVLYERDDDASTRIPPEYRELKQECANLREAAREASRVLEDIQHRTESLEKRAQVQDAFHSQAARALREINTRLISARFLSELPSRLEHIRETHDRVEAEKLGSELIDFRVDLTDQGVPAFLQEIVSFASNATDAIRKLDERQLEHEQSLLATITSIQEHEKRLGKIGWDLSIHRSRIAEHTEKIEGIYSRLDEQEGKINIILAYLQNNDSQEAIARRRELSSKAVDVIEIQRNYSSSESLGFLLYLQDALASCGIPMVAAPVFPEEGMQVRGTFTYAISCYGNPMFRACDWSFTLSKHGRSVLTQSEQNRGHASDDVRFLVQNHIASALKEKNVCALLR